MIASKWSSASFFSSSSVRSWTGWGMNTRAGSMPSDLACAGTLDELGGGDADRWNAACFEIRHVMRTARNAGPSVGQSFDDEVDFGGDLLPQRQGRHPRIGRLGVVRDGDAALREPLAETMQKHVAARFGDVENADLEPVETLRPRQARPNRRTSLRGRVE